MAVDRVSTADRARVVADPRRWAAFHTTGVYTLLLSIQASHEDIVGALENDQIGLARHGARRIALLVARIRCLMGDGVPEDDGDALADVFAGLDDDEVAATLEAVAGVVRAADVAEAKAGLAGVERLIAELVADLGFEVAPASIRTPSGLFPALRLTRELLPLNKAAHLPLVIPESWVSGPR